MAEARRSGIEANQARQDSIAELVRTSFQDASRELGLLSITPNGRGIPGRSDRPHGGGAAAGDPAGRAGRSADGCDRIHAAPAVLGGGGRTERGAVVQRVEATRGRVPWCPRASLPLLRRSLRRTRHRHLPAGPGEPGRNPPRQARLRIQGTAMRRLPILPVLAVLAGSVAHPRARRAGLMRTAPVRSWSA